MYFLGSHYEAPLDPTVMHTANIPPWGLLSGGWGEKGFSEFLYIILAFIFLLEPGESLFLGIPDTILFNGIPGPQFFLSMQGCQK